MSMDSDTTVWWNVFFSKYNELTSSQTNVDQQNAIKSIVSDKVPYYRFQYARSTAEAYYIYNETRNMDRDDAITLFNQTFSRQTPNARLVILRYFMKMKITDE